MKIAIYSGISPSTIFIERLIMGLSETDTKILLVGRKVKKSEYNSSIINATYKNLIFQIYFIFRYYFFLKKIDKAVVNFQLKSIPTFKGKLKRISEISPILYYKPDIFHIQWAKSINEWMFLKETGMKIVLSLRGAHINYSPIVDDKLALMYRNNFQFIDGFHGVSKSIIHESIKYNLDSNRAKVVYSGLKLEEWHFGSRKFVVNRNSKFIVIGRPHWIKGYSLLLDVIADFKKFNMHFCLKIIGGYNEEMLFQRNQLNLDNEVEFIENMPFNLVKENIRDSDFLILPSYKEGIANVILEAMALGTVVISSDCGGMSEVISDGHNGFLFKNRSREDLLNKLVQVSKLTSKEYETISVNARRKIEENHTEEKMVEGMIKLYNQVLAN
jgi:glycosyltransferase involved in cell wall biosynthesis